MRAAAALAICLVGCGPFLPGRYTDAEQAALLTEQIGAAYGPELQRVIVEDGRAYVQTDFTDDDMLFARPMCEDIS